MFEDKDYDSINGKYVGTEYGNLRRERAKLQQRLILHSDESVKPRIREITIQIQDAMASRPFKHKQ